MQRREFLASGAVISSAAIPTIARRKRKKNPKPRKNRGKASQTPKPEPPSEADLLLEFLRSRYKDRLTEEQYSQVRRQIRSNLQTARTMASFPLQNSDPPFAGSWLPREQTP